MRSETDERPPEVQLAVLHEVRAHQFVTEASSTGFPPGIWPRVFTVTPSIGNGREFVQVSRSRCAYTYNQVMGCVTIQVIND